MVTEIAEEVARQAEFMHRIGYMPQEVRIGIILKAYIAEEMRRLHGQIIEPEGEFRMGGLKVVWSTRYWELSVA